MSRTMRNWFIAGGILIVVGALIFTGVMTRKKWNFKLLNTVEYETNTYEITEEFTNVSIDTTVTDVIFLKSEDVNCRVVCYEPSYLKHEVLAKDETLTINVKDNRKWYENIGIDINNPTLTIYLPEKEYSSLVVKDSTGDVKLQDDFGFKSVDIIVSTGDIICKNFDTGSLNLSASTGDVKITSVTSGENTNINVSTGDVNLKDMITTEKLSIKASTGSVKFDSCDASEIYVKVSTGDVKGTLLSEKEFLADSNTGDVDVPKNGDGGKCEIKTSTGDIKIEIK